jgi:hypothetical protein
MPRKGACLSNGREISAIYGGYIQVSGNLERSMKATILFTFVTSISFGQTFLPEKDTTILNKDGSEIRYQVKPHAIYMTTYKDNKWNGPHKSFYKNGKLWSAGFRRDDKLEGKTISYTPNGDTAAIEEWKNSTLVTKIIFYQNTIKEPQKYFFVSKTGFPLLLNGIQAKLDKTTPDSLIEEGPDFAYIWIKGERKLFSGKEPAKFMLIKTGDKPGFYKVEGDTKTFIRPLTEAEKKK